MLLAICFALLGAITFRLRGSALWDRWTRTGTIGGRLQYAGVLAIAAVLATGDLHLIVLAPALFLGAVPAWWNDSLVPATGKRLAANAVRGLVWTAPAGVVLLLLGYSAGGLLLVCGAFSAPIYAAAWTIPLKPVIHDGEVVIGQGTELAEVLFGAWIGLMLWVAVCFAA